MGMVSQISPAYLGSRFKVRAKIAVGVFRRQIGGEFGRTPLSEGAADPHGKDGRAWQSGASGASVSAGRFDAHFHATL